MHSLGANQRIIRALDVSLSLAGLILLLPLMLMIALIVKLDSRGPAFFVQRRLGLQKKEFGLLKFRTMRVDAEKGGPVWASENDSRITGFGRFLRKSRLDELPQLINILIGDLSLVGPRPIRAHFAEMLASREPKYDLRFTVKPGLTGYAQIYAPYGTTVDDQLKKVPYDLWYIDGLSIYEYFRILLLTLVTVVKGKGI